MTDFRDDIRNPDCELCPLNETAQHVCLMGDNPNPVKIMIVGEAPGEREDDEGRAFVGASGGLLNKALKHKAKIKRSDCYVTNAVKCRPPENKTPSTSQVKTCSAAYLEDEINAVRPDYILPLGNSALRAVLGRSGITKHRGQPVDKHGAVVFPTYHPAAVLRNPRYAAEFDADFAAFGRLVRGESSPGATTSIRIVRTQSQLAWLTRKLSEAEEIAYDIETTGLEEWREDAAVVSIGFSWEEGQAAVVPITHKNTPWRNPAQVLAKLKSGLERSDCRYIAHNGKFDARYLARFGIFVNQTFDTMLAAHILDENRPKGLKSLSQVILGADAYDIGDDVMDAYNAPLKRLCIYNGKDCDYTLRLYHEFKREFKEKGNHRLARVFKLLMMPSSNVLTEVEYGGIYLDPDKLEQRYNEAVRNRDLLEKHLRRYLSSEQRLRGKNPKTKKEAKERFNFNSTQQVGEWLFGTLGLDILEYTDSGAPSTKESVLLRLAKEHEACRALLKYRKWAKYVSTYLSKWRDNIRDRRGYIHPNYKLFGTVTGRLSESGTGLQQVPRDVFIRGVLAAPPGWRLVECDYSQIELRIAAVLANERNMLRQFHSGVDIHLTTAAAAARKSIDLITKEERKMAKAVNFGFIYGMGHYKFVEYARDNYDVIVTEEEAKQFRNAFFDTYPRLRPWHDRQRRIAHRQGYVESRIGRARHLPDLRSETKSIRAEAERQAINSPVQSLASDLMLMSMLRLHASLPRREARIIGSIHDALLFQVREEAVDELTPKIIRTMENPPLKRWFGADLEVPIEVEAKVGQYWSEGAVVYGS